MPRLATVQAVLCSTHGRRCRLAGGSPYHSTFCRSSGPGVPGDLEELDVLIRDARARAAVARGAAVEVAEREAEEQRQRDVAERLRWSKLSCRAVDDEIRARWSALSPEVRAGRELDGLPVLERAELAQMIRDAQSRIRAMRPARVLAGRHEPAQPPEERAPGGVDLLPPPGVADLAAARRRRPRRPRVGLRIVDIGWDDDDDEDDGYDF